MTVRNTAFAKDNSNLTFTQDTNVNVGTDKRRWIAKKASDIYKFWLDFHLCPKKQINDSDVVGDIVLRWDTLPETGVICIDRDVKYEYIVAGGGTVGVFNSNVYKIDIETQTVISSNQILDAAITPLKALINYDGDKIIWLGDNNILYKMDLDGGNLESFTYGVSIDTFALVNNVVYMISMKTLYSVNLYNNHKNSNAIFTNTYYPKSAFGYNNKVYFSGVGINPVISGVVIAYDIALGSATIINTTTDYDIVGSSIKKFNLAHTEEDGYFGILCENNGADRKIMWKVNLETLVLTPLRLIEKTVNGNLKKLVAEFSNDTSKDYAVIDTDGANDDWTGCERVQVFS